MSVFNLFRVSDDEITSLHFVSFVMTVWVGHYDELGGGNLFNESF
ncbi:hypothetical protein [uncultured Tenacibaculum sp.]|nr:hypothetical protein [uncultured Tenacibaculum sp.]